MTDSERLIKDAIRAAYDDGYNDGKMDGDSGCSRYIGRNVEVERGNKLIAALAAAPSAANDRVLQFARETIASLEEENDKLRAQIAAPSAAPGDAQTAHQHDWKPADDLGKGVVMCECGFAKWPEGATATAHVAAAPAAPQQDEVAHWKELALQRASLLREIGVLARKGLTRPIAAPAAPSGARHKVPCSHDQAVCSTPAYCHANGRDKTAPSGAQEPKSIAGDRQFTVLLANYMDVVEDMAGKEDYFNHCSKARKAMTDYIDAMLHRTP
jgi:hypothetical protein